MNRNWHRHAVSGLPILSAALLAATGLLWEGANSNAAAQSSSGASGDVIVNYDVLNSLPGQPAPYGAHGAPAGMQPQSQLMPYYPPAVGAYGAITTLAPYIPYGAMQPRFAYAPGLTPPLPPPAGTPMSALTTVGPDGRPIAPITLRNPGAGMLSPQEFAAQMQTTPAVVGGAAAADATPPGEPAEMPTEVSMPEATPAAPPPAASADALAAATPAAETPDAPAATPEAPAEAAVAAAETPAPEEAAEQPVPDPAGEQAAQEASTETPPAETPSAETPPAETPPAETPPAETPPAETPSAETSSAETPPAETPTAETAPAEGEAAGTEPEEQPAEEAATEPAAEPDNTQPAAPIPQGGIRIIFPVDLNDVPVEANAALDDLAAQMQADESLRIQIKCYASGTEETESKARRKSLARCINIRQYLFKKDVRTTRMDVRALGLKSEGQPADRVDIVPASS